MLRHSAPITLDIASLSDPGTVRKRNEDSLAIVDCDGPDGSGKGMLLVVADGLGGYHGGEVASGMVTTEMPKLYAAAGGSNAVEDIVQAAEMCNRKLHEAALSVPELGGMGSTMVAALVIEQSLILAHVGDSRGYLFRHGTVVHRTEDHTTEGRAATPARASRRVAHVLTRALGPRPAVQIDVTRLPLEAGDVLVLCTDGLSGSVDEDMIAAVVTRHASADAVAILVQLAKDRKSQDNISVVVARVCHLN